MKEKNLKQTIANNVHHQEYQANIKMIEDFFHGKSNGIKLALKAEIDECIATENFEWAAKLRDIYKNIDQFTEKQTIMMEAGLNGVVAKVVLAEKKRIYVILVFQKGKLVDVLRFSESIQELDKDQIISSIALEFGDLDLLDKLKYPHGDTYYSK